MNCSDTRSRWVGILHGRSLSLLCAAALLSACASQGGSSGPMVGFGLSDAAQEPLPEDAPWSVLQTQLPEAPDWSQGTRVFVDDLTRFEFRVDPDSLRMAPGGVVRYVLMSRSDQGAESRTWEALRCRTGERRLLAVWGADAWGPAQDDSWRDTGARSSATAAQRALHRGVLCTGGGPAAADVRGLQQRLANNRTIREAQR